MSVTTSKSQRAYDFVKERIASGRYAPGHRLVLAGIASDLDISVVPVREAIRRLEAERLVVFERNVGAQVAMLDESDYVHTMQALALLEGYATALAAPRLDSDHLDRARQVNEQMRLSLAHFHPHAFTEQNREFHSVLFKRCPNPQILDLVRASWERMSGLRDSTFSFVPGRAHDSVREHDELLTLIADGADPGVIERAAREHRLATVDSLLTYRGGQLLPE